MKMHNLSDAEFKILVTRIPNELGGRTDELSDKLHKEIEIMKKN